VSNKLDLFGKALWDYYKKKGANKIITWTSLTEEDPILLSYFFRSFDEMPKLEQKALKLSKGKVLDVGCGAGSHSLYLQNKMKLEVFGIDHSPGAIATANARGLKNTIEQSIFNYKEEIFDTILLLMNGPGICGKLKNLRGLLIHLASLLDYGGQILLDSSNLIYLFDQTESGERIVPASNYYGELEYGISYDNKTITFPWLYVDIENLKQAASEVGLITHIIMRGENWDYLARLVKEC
jgi:SAM-dependent methyltransferase|tara:strand:+ start:2601 stop:3317 length:717 start_codon:yes stop_codon:yes gene_type:complete